MARFSPYNCVSDFDKMDICTSYAFRYCSNEGIRGLYRGFGVTLLAGAPASMLYFTSYELARDSLQKSHPLLQKWTFATHLAAGMLAEAARSVSPFVPSFTCQDFS
jgi:hypothetical protein